MPQSRVVGTGHYLPPKVVTNFDVMKMMDTSDEFIVTRTGVRERRYAEADVSASDLAAEACRAAVEDRSEEHTSELQSHHDLVCRLLLEKKK